MTESVEYTFEQYLDETAEDTLLRIRNLRKWYPVTENRVLFSRVVGHIKAVDGVSIDIPRGKTMGLVGESGCGKSTLARTVVRLEPFQAGTLFLEDQNISTFKSRREELAFRRRVQMVFQDPYASLNPRRLVMDIIKEPLDIHRKDLGHEEKKRMVIELLQTVGLEAYHALRYPHEFSGGQRQRIGIARALILQPDLILLDEPVSALDVSVQASILNLLHDLQEQFGLAYLFIAHDLSVVKHVSDYVSIMYLGRLVEVGPVEEVFNHPTHPYTVSLLSAIPIPDPDIEKARIILQGDVPSPINLPPGCRFHPRCYKAQEICSEVEPELREVRSGVWSACHFPEEGFEVLKFIGLDNEREAKIGKDTSTGKASSKAGATEGKTATNNKETEV